MNYPFEKEQAGALVLASFFLLTTAQTDAPDTAVWFGGGATLIAMTYCVSLPLVVSAPELIKRAASLEGKDSFVRSVLSALVAGGFGAFFLFAFTLVVVVLTVFGAFSAASLVGGLDEDVNGFVSLTLALWAVLTLSVVFCGFLELMAQSAQYGGKGKEPPRWVRWYLKQDDQLRLFLSTVVGSLVMSSIVMGDLALKAVV